MSEQRPSPYSADAERAVLASLLVAPECYDEIADLFTPESFYIPAHTSIAESVVALRAANQPLDPVVLQNHLASRGLLGDTAATVMDLVRSLGTSSNVRAYMQIVRGLWAKRQLAALARELHAAAYDPEVTGQDAVASAAARLSAIETGSAKKARKLGRIIEQRVAQLQDERENPAVSDRVAFTGFERLDWLTGGLHWGKSGTPIIVGARQGVGKTAFASAIADNVAMQGVPVGVFQLEDEEGSVAERAIARRAKITSLQLRNPDTMGQGEWDRLMGPGIADTLELPIFVDDTHALTAAELGGRMRRMAREHGCRVFIFDHGKEIKYPERKDGRHDLAIGDGLRHLRDVAKDLRAVPIILWQLNRETDKRADARPAVTDLRDSSEIEAIARGIWLLQRQGSAFLVHVEKNTGGPVATVPCRWLENYMAVENVAAQT